MVLSSVDIHLHSSWLFAEAWMWGHRQLVGSFGRGCHMLSTELTPPAVTQESQSVVNPGLLTVANLEGDLMLIKRAR